MPRRLRNPLPLVKEHDVRNNTDRTRLQAVFQDWFAIYKERLLAYGLLAHGALRWDLLTDMNTDFVDVYHVCDWVSDWVKANNVMGPGESIKTMSQRWLMYGTFPPERTPSINENLTADTLAYEKATGEDLRGNHVVESQLVDMLRDWWFADSLGTLGDFRRAYETSSFDSVADIKLAIGRTIWKAKFSDQPTDPITGRFKDIDYLQLCISKLLLYTQLGHQILTAVLREVADERERIEAVRRRQRTMNREEDNLDREIDLTELDLHIADVERRERHRSQRARNEEVEEQEWRRHHRRDREGRHHRDDRRHRR